MDYFQKLNRNLRLFNWLSFFTGLIFVIPIWVAFERRILSFTQMALIEAIASFVIIALEMPTGALADLIGRRRTIIFGLIIRGLGNVYLGFASNFFMFCFGYFFCSIGTVFVSGADTALAFDSLKELKKENDYPKFAAKNGLFHRSAIIIATLFGGLFYRLWPGLPYAGQGIMEILSAIFVLKMVEPKIDTVKFTLKNYLSQTKTGFQQLFQNSYVTRLTLYYTLVAGITWSCLYYFNQPFATDLGFSEVGLGYLFSAIYLLTTTLIYWLTSKGVILLNKTKVFLGFPVIMIISFIPGIFANKIIGSLLLFGITLAGSARFSILDRFTNAEYESKYRATASSSLNMLVSLFYVIIVGISGKLQDLYSTKLIFTLLGLISIGILPVAFNLIKHYDHNHQTNP